LLRVLACAVLAAAGVQAAPGLRYTRVIVQERDGAVMPMVRATVAGRQIDLLLDSGAIRSILPASFVKAAGLTPYPSGGQFTDANGARALVMDLPPLAVLFDGAETPATLGFAVGSGGLAILALRDLLEPGWALTLDLEHEALRLDPEEVALARPRDSPAKRWKLPFRQCRGESASDKTHRVVYVNVNGFASAMLVDTGASRTALFDDHPAGRSIAQMPATPMEIVGAGSTGGSGTTVDALPVTFVGMTLKLKTALIPGKQSCGHGLLGADVLRHCVLVWGQSALWASCHAA
jgi:predicted aspartyl protease